MKKLTGPKLLVGDACSCPDLEYVTRFRATDPVVALVRGAQRYLVVPELELGRATRAAHRCHVLTPAQLGVPLGQQRLIREWALALLRSERVTTVTVGPTFPLEVARGLERARVRLLVHDTLFPARAVKTEREIGLLRQSQRAAVGAMRAVIGAIRESRPRRDRTLIWRGKPLTSERMHLEIRRVLLDANCSAPMTIVAGGRQGADPHEAGHGPLRANEPIVIDIFPKHNGHGYWGDITRTVVKGVPTPRLRGMYRAVRKAQEEALRMVRPGASSAGIHRRVVECFSEHGFESGEADGAMYGFFHGTGHGVGLDIHEAPNVGRARTRLRAGHVITIEPGLYYPEIGGVRIEDTVVVTKGGCSLLGRCAKRLVV